MKPQHFIAKRAWIAPLSLLMLLGAGRLFAFVDNQNAQYVLGRPDFVANTYPSGAATPNEFMSTRAIFVSDLGLKRVYVADVRNFRVLVFDVTTTGFVNGMDAKDVLGQINLTSKDYASPPTASSLVPYDLAYDYTRHWLFVLDVNRVLVFKVDGGITPLMDATYVIGQGSFTTRSDVGGGCGANPPNSGTRHNLDLPFGIALDSDTVNPRLFVSDECNNRVLVFDVRTAALNACSPLSPSGEVANGCDATHVLGASDFSSVGGGVGTADVLWRPWGLAYDSTQQRLFVADREANRVLVFNASPSAFLTCGSLGFPACKAINVIGQKDFFPATVATTQNGMWWPHMLDFDPVGQRLFVAEYQNYRVLEYDLKGGITNGMNASHVLGQQDFLSKDASTPPTPRSLGFPSVSYDATGKRLLVGDGVAFRTLIFTENELAGTPNVGCAGSNDFAICGTVTASEGSNPPLPRIPIELRDGQGRLVTTKKTDSSGTFIFKGLTAGVTYFVTPVLDRIQSAVPLQVSVPNLSSVGAIANLQVRGVPGMLRIAAPPGSSILVSTSSYVGMNAPAINPSGQARRTFYSAGAGADGFATLLVPNGISYFVTCWKAQSSGASVNYGRSPDSGSIATPLVALDGPTLVSCTP